MSNYLKIARINNWTKQFLVLIGAAFAIYVTKDYEWRGYVWRIVFAVLAVCFIASANYVINEWLDAPTDRYHPKKKNRPCIVARLNPHFISIEYAVFCVLGLSLAAAVDFYIFASVMILLWLGIFYNVKPIRTKDIVFIDILCEAANNIARFVVGWLCVTTKSFPHVSILLACWFACAFLLSLKRFREIKLFASKLDASLYRKSFKYYSRWGLLTLAILFLLAGAGCAVWFFV